MIDAAQRCRRCGAVLNANEVKGLCPVCLLDSSLAESDEPTVEGCAQPGELGSAEAAEKIREREGMHRLGDYELLEEIGRGGMGVIYRARQVSLDRLVAVKTILTGPLASPDFAQRFHTEAHAAAVLEHPNIVPIYEVGNYQGQPFYSMRLIPGRNLAQELKETGAMPPCRAAELLVTVARAVHYAHERGVLHRDLKPANILLDAEGHPYVTDFGLAKLLEHDDGLTLTQAALGTPNYMAPEQAAGDVKHLTTASDVYSLGAILFELLTGRKLFTADTPLATINRAREQEPPKPSSILRTIPRDLDTICWKCLEKEPPRRYASALALAEDLERWLKGEPIHARPVGAVERLGLWCRRKPAMAGIAGAALLVVLLISGISTWRLMVAHGQKQLEQYAANISLADSSIRAGSIDIALDYLIKCPERLRHWEWGHLLFECLQEVSTIPAHTNRPQYLTRPLLQDLAFSRQGDRLSSRGLDGSLAVWDPIEGIEIFRVGDATNRVTASSFRPGHKEIAVGRLDGSVAILDTSTGRLVRQLIPPHAEWTNQLVDPVISQNYDVYDTSLIRDPLRRRPWAPIGINWDPAGSRIALTLAEGTLIIRKPERSASEWERRDAAPGKMTGTWFTPEGSEIVIQASGLVQRVDAATGRTLGEGRWTPPPGIFHGGWVLASQGAWASPTGDRVVTLDAEGQATLRDERGVIADLGRLVKRNFNAPLAVFFSTDGALFCTTGDVGSARVFRADTGEALFALPDTIYGGAFSARGDQLAVFGLDRIVHLWDVPHQLEVRPLRGHLSSITVLSYAPNGLLIATGSRDGVVKLWSAHHHGKVFFGETLTTVSSYSPDGQWLATGPNFRGLCLWDANTGILKWKLPSRTQTILSMVFSPDGCLLYTAGSDRCVRIYNVADGQPAGIFRGHQCPAWAVHCSPDGQWVATGDADGIVKIWDARTRVEKLTLAAHPSAVGSVCFDRASRFLVTAGSGKPRVWEIGTGKLVIELDESGAGTFAASFSPDARNVLAACLDNQIRVWEIPSGRLAARWTSQTQGLSYQCYSPDGLRFTVPGADMGVLGSSLPKLEIWDAQHGRVLLNLEAHRESMYAAMFDASGRKVVTSSMDTTVRQWEAFPWKDAGYSEPAGSSLAQRVRHYAQKYWRKRVAQAKDISANLPVLQEKPMPPGIPDWERDRWPKRDAAASPQQIDLDRYYTGVLDAIFYPSWMDNELADDLSSLPTGLQLFGGVLFDVRGVIWLRSKLPDLTDSAFRATCQDFPDRVEGIEVRRKLHKLHVLHAASAYFGVTPGFGTNAVGNPLPIGAYVLHYVDGNRHEFEIQYGRDLRHWWWGGRGDDKPEAECAKVAWVGTNVVSARYEAKLRLFLSTFENPRPDVEVVSVDFISKQTPFAPFLVAMTVE